MGMWNTGKQGALELDKLQDLKMMDVGWMELVSPL